MLTSRLCAPTLTEIQDVPEELMTQGDNLQTGLQAQLDQLNAATSKLEAATAQLRTADPAAPAPPSA